MKANLKETQFVKTESFGINNVESIIKVISGTNKKGENMQYINQVNTCNTAVCDVERDFEDFKINLEEMKNILNKEGYFTK